MIIDCRVRAGQDAEAEGFEPPDGLPSSAFKADAFGRSATLPWGQRSGGYGAGHAGGGGLSGSPSCVTVDTPVIWVVTERPYRTVSVDFCCSGALLGLCRPGGRGMLVPDGRSTALLVRQPGVPGSGGPSGGIWWCDADKAADDGVPSAASPRSSLACIGPIPTVSGRGRVSRVRRRLRRPSRVPRRC